MDIIQCNLSSFRGEALQGRRDVISSSRDLARNAQVYTDFELMQQSVEKRFRRHLKKFKKEAKRA
jgi:hypothetical protein